MYRILKFPSNVIGLVTRGSSFKIRVSFDRIIVYYSKAGSYLHNHQHVQQWCVDIPCSELSVDLSYFKMCQRSTYSFVNEEHVISKLLDKQIHASVINRYQTPSLYRFICKDLYTNHGINLVVYKIPIGLAGWVEMLKINKSELRPALLAFLWASQLDIIADIKMIILQALASLLSVDPIMICR